MQSLKLHTGDILFNLIIPDLKQLAEHSCLPYSLDSFPVKKFAAIGKCTGELQDRKKGIIMYTSEANASVIFNSAPGF